MNNGIKETLQGLATELGMESPVADEQAGRPAVSGDQATAPSTGRSTRATLMQPQAQVPAAATAARRVKHGSASASREFGISVASGRIYIQNAAGKVIEVGDMIEEQGIYGYRLDVGAIQGQQFGSLDSALRHLAAQLTHLYLNQMFLQLPDSAAEAGAHSISRPALRIELAEGTDELRGQQDTGG